MGLEELRERLASDPEFRTEYEREYPYECFADAIIELRADLDLTQAGLAERLGTSQSVIARAESGQHSFRIALLSRMAEAAGAEIRMSFVPRATEAPPDDNKVFFLTNVRPVARPLALPDDESFEAGSGTLLRLANQ